MKDLIERLPPGARVLDLGAAAGSFDTGRAEVAVIRLDLKIPAARGKGSYVTANAAAMPFRNAAFQAVIANHSLEHLVELEAALREMGRVIRPGGGLYVSVPDAGTLTDRIYRWLGKGGGHVNPFRSAAEVARLVEGLTGLPHRGTRTLFSGLSFLNAHNFTAPPPRKIALFAWGNEKFLAGFVWLLRWLDARLGTSLSHYGWALYFGAAEAPHAAEDWVNVCVRCGAGASETWLRKSTPVPAAGLLKWYRCPVCGGLNLLSRE